MQYQPEKIGSSCKTNKNQRWLNCFSGFCSVYGVVYCSGKSSSQPKRCFCQGKVIYGINAAAYFGFDKPKKSFTVMPSQMFFLIQPMDASWRLIFSSAQRPMSVCVTKKLQFCVFPVIKETLLCAILKLFTETTIEIPCKVVLMLVILTMFRSSFAGSVLRYERLFESNMFQM